MSDKTLTGLADALSKAEREERSLNALIQEEIDTARKEINEKYRDQVKVVADIRWEAYRAYRDEKDRLAIEKTMTSLPYPLGTVFVEFAKKAYQGNVSPTGREAVLELVKDRCHENFPDNLASYSIPEPGTLILRFLKKDGKAGKPFERYGRSWREWRVKGGQEGTKG